MSQELRNIAIIAHVDHGKTTLIDSIMKQSGMFRENESVSERLMDSGDLEKERGITILAKPTSIAWENIRINIIDTPGHVDFTFEVYRSMKVLDGGVVVFCGSGGVEPQSETNWRYANESEVARIIYVNKMDRIGSDFTNVVDMMRDRLGANAHPVQYPLGEGELFTGMVDIIERKAIIFEDEMGSEVTEGPVPDDLTDIIEELRNALLEAAVEHLSLIHI